MRLVSWNCCRSFHRKIQEVAELSADVTIIIECTEEDAVQAESALGKCFWFGNNKSSIGMAVFCKSSLNAKATVASLQQGEDASFVIPIELATSNKTVNLIAVWSAPDNNPSQNYPRVVWDGLNANEALLDGSVMIIGDFNSGVYFDQKIKGIKHAQVLELLQSKGILSAYHEYYQEPQGSETRPTHLWRRSLDKPFHIDYCFLSSDLLESVEEFEVGTPKDWLDLSDHVPLILDLDSAIF